MDLGWEGVEAVIAIFLACLGLFGLTSFTAERRSRPPHPILSIPCGMSKSIYFDTDNKVGFNY